MNSDWVFSSVFSEMMSNAPDNAEELRIDRHGRLYWCDKGKRSWTKGVIDENYSAISKDIVIAKKNG